MMKLEVTSTRMTFVDRSFVFVINGPRVWNSLPASIHDQTLSVIVFSNRLKGLFPLRMRVALRGER